MLLLGAGTHETVCLEVPTGGGFYGLQQMGIWASPGKSTDLELSFQKGTPIGSLLVKLAQQLLYNNLPLHTFF